jgi:hypothetical protein
MAEREKLGVARPLIGDLKPKHLLHYQRHDEGLLSKHSPPEEAE